MASLTTNPHCSVVLAWTYALAKTIINWQVRILFEAWKKYIRTKAKLEDKSLDLRSQFAITKDYQLPSTGS